MPRGSVEIPLPITPGGVREDLTITELPLGTWLASHNFLTRYGSGRPRPGYVAFSVAPDAGRVLGFGFRGSQSDPNSLVTHLESQAFGYIASVGTDITGAWNTSSADYPVRFATLPSGGDVNVVRVNLLNQLDYWDGTGSFQSPTQTAPAGIDVCIVSNRVMVAHTDDGTRNPYQVRWSDFNDLNAWPTGTANTAELASTPDTIVACSALTPLAAAIYKEESVWLAQAVAAKNPFQFQLIAPVPGPLSPAAVIAYRGAQYWLAHDGAIYAFDGTQPRPVSAGASRSFLATFDWSARMRVHAFSVSLSEPELWWIYPVTGTQEPTRALCLNLATGALTTHEFAHAITASAEWGIQSEVIWDTLPEATWSALAYASWTELLALATHPVAIFGGLAGATYLFGVAAEDAGEDIDWTVTQPWRQPAPNGRAVVDCVAAHWAIEDASLPVTVTLTASDNLGGQEIATSRTYDVTTDDQHIVTFGDVRGRFIKVTQAGDRATTTLAHRGALLRAWPRGYV